MAGDVPSPGGQTGLKPPSQECMACKKTITERFYLKAMEHYWHEDCLKCSCCDCRLGEVGSTLFSKANLLLCRRDYLRLFGNTGYCAACKKMIPAFEMVMRAKTNVYHLECFACQQCLHRFCVGDRFYLADNKILCQIDYEERFMLANLAVGANNMANLGNNHSSNMGNNNGNNNINNHSNNNHSGGNINTANNNICNSNNNLGIPNGFNTGGIGAGSGGGGSVGPGIGMGGHAGGLVGGGAGVGGVGGMGPTMAMNSSFGYGGGSGGYNALTQMKRQTQSLSDDVSSGYGSPSPSSL